MDPLYFLLLLAQSCNFNLWNCTYFSKARIHCCELKIASPHLAATGRLGGWDGRDSPNLQPNDITSSCVTSYLARSIRICTIIFRSMKKKRNLLQRGLHSQPSLEHLAHQINHISSQEALGDLGSNWHNGWLKEEQKNLCWRLVLASELVSLNIKRRTN